MARPGPALERDLATYAAEVRTALGERLVAVVLYGSAAGEDWVAGRSDVNVAIVVERVTLAVLEALVPVVGRYRPRGFVLPLMVDQAYLDRARDVFPMELDDIRRQHRILAGKDVFGAIPLDPKALRLQCEHEARAKLLRLRALFLEVAGKPPALENVMAGSLKSFLVLLRHWLGLRGVVAPAGYAAVLAAGETALGPLPVMRRLLAHRIGTAVLPPEALRETFGEYLAEVERITAAIDAEHA